MEQLKVVDNIDGLMETLILVFSKQVRNKAKVFGKRLLMSRKTQINMRVSTLMI